ncbi:MAG: bifunctional 2-C-methyl-D-erythritol 4-phosphate cytidylyltransferase/2-C-methyl-D-erythritol 2,4-cyclodiphosphate synthase [Devosia sp.]|uniref:bifunctional 2-C-methyl-D-erythritol 4-phosphate cytidylyltransferase/2-C-methyl-D-erythritol 2,4-cyclodiphosphate synthase n=1 Tax=Devosia sp. 66-22 TaxID=1895753 RepID=UPI000928A1B1|nr:bifunctional 2-C-methyl-D-erythritol 4-phosphate cytidylyltransferase/2-C-methyl-D-erythritol 2,4-cyclodiphosphate synthase [Devosia sp. 66-22]MBN9347672.1 bifunctional 2-C-methyl-D-erythritol 4-phosphate cytidylyltransferase/2-C-methyl-D-erythritol 2,4-cyclodiphosphate synthase [Devosia sp.]OJX53750.1 MAG: bifunctional 2-C-methyl-D-erythritol 4-phosphate cytidylyltransferase/2-C-methyl-D-erythritol 2,4-cyclodiphosphate synthase [Devosia sp. 66-22]
MPDQKTIAVIIVAAGIGERMGGGPKQYRPLAGTPVLARTIAAFTARPDVTWVLPVLNPSHTDLYAALNLNGSKLLPAVGGAPTRQGSVLAGLEALAPHRPDLVLIQDAARPLIDDDTISGVLAALGEAALPVLPVTDTIKRSSDGRLAEGTEDRRTLFAAQTPQGFAYPAILDAHRRAASEPTEFTDDAAIAEWAGIPVTLTKGSPRNIKLTHPEDFERAERLLGGRPMETRTGTGYDVHPFEPGDAVWLGGVRIPHTARLKGHSDADAALHALTDALYGALGEGDIGTFFPPSDPHWKGAASSVFLEHAARLVAARGGRIVNLDITIVSEAPKISPHVPTMKAVIAETCGISPARVAIKATTSEKLGFVGRGEGLTSLATATVELPRGDD